MNTPELLILAVGLTVAFVVLIEYVASLIENDKESKTMSRIQVELQEHMGSDASIANAAWTSTYDKSRREDKYDDPEKVADIVRRCVRDGHSVPLESVIFRFWIRMPIFTDRQHMTHRIASHNGLSGRYRTLPSDFFTFPADVEEIMNKTDGWGAASAGSFVALCQSAYDYYRQGLDLLRKAEAEGKVTNSEFKRAREILRAVLPTASMVERTTIMNLVSFANYQRLRNSDHAQPEIRRVAELMLHEVVYAGIAETAIAELFQRGWRIG